LENSGFKVNPYDENLFSFYNGTKVAHILVYVDDLLIFANHEDILLLTKELLHSRFKIKDLGPAQKFLGMRLLRTNNAIYLYQDMKINELAQSYGLQDAKLVSTPMTQGLQLDREDANINVQYQSAIGSLNYLQNCTRPDISYAVNYLSRFNLYSGKRHWQAIQRIIKYLKSTSDYSIVFKKGHNDIVDICCYSDADWAGYKVDRFSTQGYTILINGTPICWRSNKQKTCAGSSTVAEYLAMYSASLELQWVKNMVHSLRFKFDRPILLTDSRTSINIIQNCSNISAIRHLEQKYQGLKDLYTRRVIHIDHVSTQDQIADIFTKALGDIVHSRLWVSEQLSSRDQLS
jgi:hypothetical protein